MSYFSDREQGERARDQDEIDEAVWGGIQTLIGTRIDDGSLGAAFPVMCTDGGDQSERMKPLFGS
jgi:hypothetical protein